MTITFELYTGGSSYVSSPSQRPNTAYLKANNWDDYGFKTLFALVVFDSKGGRHNIGGVKIGFTSVMSLDGYLNLLKNALKL